MKTYEIFYLEIMKSRPIFTCFVFGKYILVQLRKSFFNMEIWDCKLLDILYSLNYIFLTPVYHFNIENWEKRDTPRSYFMLEFSIDIQGVHRQVKHTEILEKTIN